MRNDFVSLIILNNPGNYNLKFAGIAFHKNRKDYCLLVTFPGGDEILKRQYNSIRSAKIAFSRIHSTDSREKNTKPDWSREILSYTYRDGIKKEEGIIKSNGG